MQRNAKGETLDEQLSDLFVSRGRDERAMAPEITAA
jgi:hypothetical protein